MTFCELFYVPVWQLYIFLVPPCSGLVFSSSSHIKSGYFMVFFDFNKTVSTFCALGEPHLRFDGASSLVTAWGSWILQFFTTLVPLPTSSDGSISLLALIIYPFSRQLNSGYACEYYTPMQWSLTGGLLKDE